MYENWIIERWTTPVSDAKLSMVSLVDNNSSLDITVQDLDAKRFCFSFSSYPAYRNIMEKYRLELWGHLYDKLKMKPCSTWIIKDSPWVASFHINEDLLEVHYPNLIHFMISTEDDVIEVLSPDLPKIKNLESGKKGEFVGKSQAYYSPKDRDKIEKIIKEMKNDS